MLRSLYLKTLRDQRHALLGWSVGVSLLVLVECALWPSIRDMPHWDQLISSYPEAMKKLFSVDAMTTGRGFLDAELFTLLLPALFIVFGIGRGARLLAGEEDDGTLEILLVTPLSTTRVLLEKAAALVTSLAVLGVVLAVTTQVCSWVFGLGLGPGASLTGSLAVTLLGVEFGCLALAVGAVTGRRGAALGVATVAATAAYVLYAAATLVSSLSGWRGWSPFDQVLSRGPLASWLPGSAAWVLLVTLVVVAAAAPRFARRDIAVA
jgi:ABC-2 type transport system permease protein